MKNIVNGIIEKVDENIYYLNKNNYYEYIENIVNNNNNNVIYVINRGNIDNDHNNDYHNNLINKIKKNKNTYIITKEIVENLVNNGYDKDHSDLFDNVSALKNIILNVKNDDNIKNIIINYNIISDNNIKNHTDIFRLNTLFHIIDKNIIVFVNDPNDSCNYNKKYKNVDEFYVI